MKFIVAMLVVVGAALAYSVPAMAGDENTKVFVCKYVGTPGVDETLQTGQNPIDVSLSAVGGAAVGSFFNDSQGRSFVLAVDVGQDPPGVDQCPPPDNPPPVDVCTNIDGLQTTVPEGFHAGEDADGRPICIEDTPPPPVDVCPNLPGDQATVPPGFTLEDGVCLPVVITPFCAPPQVFNPLTGLCEGGGLPPTPPTEPRGVAAVFCDSGAKLYRIVGTIDGFAIDSVIPPTIAGNVHGTTNVTLRRGDTTVRTSVFTMGDCDTTVPPVAAPFTPPVVVGTPAAPKPPAPVAKPKPAPVRKPVAKKKVVTHKAVKRHATVHICKPVNGHMRVWVKSGANKGCQYVGKPEPSHLTG